MGAKNKVVMLNCKNAIKSGYNNPKKMKNDLLLAWSQAAQRPYTCIPDKWACALSLPKHRTEQSCFLPGMGKVTEVLDSYPPI
jgi:hypothetical protein